MCIVCCVEAEASLSQLHLYQMQSTLLNGNIIINLYISIILLIYINLSIYSNPLLINVQVICNSTKLFKNCSLVFEVSDFKISFSLDAHTQKLQTKYYCNSNLCSMLDKCSILFVCDNHLHINQERLILSRTKKGKDLT